jgi:succinate dehydrogenase/fumarate reductase flavoprotein subunit
MSDRSMWANTSFVFTRQMYNMLQLSRVITQGALLRNESRGAQYNPLLPSSTFLAPRSARSAAAEVPVGRRCRRMMDFVLFRAEFWT